MVEKWVPSLPYVSTFMARVGQIVGTPENCRRLLQNDEAILVFPEGIPGIAISMEPSDGKDTIRRTQMAIVSRAGLKSSTRPANVAIVRGL